MESTTNSTNFWLMMLHLLPTEWRLSNRVSLSTVRTWKKNSGVRVKTSKKKKYTFNLKPCRLLTSQDPVRCGERLNELGMMPRRKPKQLRLKLIHQKIMKQLVLQLLMLSINLLPHRWFKEFRNPNKPQKQNLISHKVTTNSVQYLASTTGAPWEAATSSRMFWTSRRDSRWFLDTHQIHDRRRCLSRQPRSAEILTMNSPNQNLHLILWI